MRVLYIQREFPQQKLKRRLNAAIKGFTDGQEGFFDASLHEAAQVRDVTLAQFQGMSPAALNRFDALVVNARCGVLFDAVDAEFMAQLAGFQGAKALFLHYAHPEWMSPDAVLDRFDVVFKREPWRDRERYDLSTANRDKLVPTHLSNPFLKTYRKWTWRNRNQPLPKYGWQHEPVHDVGFLGSVGGSKVNLRSDIWTRIKQEDFRAFGGLIAIRGHSVPSDLEGRKLGKPEYMREVMQTAVNLALSGHGPFTYRHLELLWAGAFVLSNGEIREQELRAPLIEDHDYVAFDSLDEMVEKTRHYLADDAARQRIAQNGRAAYEVLHDTAAHAREIRAALGDRG